MLSSTRGYSVLALVNPKTEANVGGVMRAAGVYSAALVIISGTRFKKLKNLPTDTMKVWKHTPVIETSCVFDAFPHDCVPVGVEFLEDALSLPLYTHPERAVYIFGAEDATLGKQVLDRCRDVIKVPTEQCMNLAATANVVLYDRLAKQLRKGLRDGR